MNRCTCSRPTRAGDRLRCTSCGGLTPYGRRQPRGGFTETIDELRSLLDRIAADWAGFGDDPAPARRGEQNGSTNIAWSDPTSAAALAHRRTYIDDWLTLTARFLDRARLDLRRADEAIGRALYVADPSPPERLAGHWWDNMPVVDTSGADDSERAELLRAQARRRARGES